MRRSLGTAVFSGMLGVTLFGIFLTPVFYYVIQWFGTPAQPAIPHEANGAASNGEVAAHRRRDAGGGPALRRRSRSLSDETRHVSPSHPPPGAIGGTS